MRFVISLTLLLLVFSNVYSQQASYFDPAQAYNRLLIERNNGTHMRIGNYKVIGSPFLFGEKNGGHMFSASESAQNILLSYNTYDQNIDFYSSANPSSPLVKEPGTLDSFILKKDQQADRPFDLVFIYGSLLGSKEKVYFQLVAKGQKVNLYKRYTCTLEESSSNIVQRDLRQFNIVVDYFYTDSTNKSIKKLKVNPTSLKKEFASIKDISSIIDVDLLTSERESELTRIFGELNKD